MEKTYVKLFNEKKDTRKDFISKLRTLLIWNEKNPNNTNINEEIMRSLEPLQNKDFLNVKEFIVGCYLLFLSRIIKMPIKLPKSLLKYLGRNTNIIFINNNNYLTNENNKRYQLVKKEYMKISPDNTYNNYITNQNNTKLQIIKKEYMKTSPDNKNNNNNLTNQTNKRYQILKKEYMNINPDNNYNQEIYRMKNINQLNKQDENNKKSNDIINQQSNNNNKRNLINADKNINNKVMEDSGVEIDNLLKLIEEVKQKENNSQSMSNIPISNTNTFSTNHKTIAKSEYVLGSIGNNSINNTFTQTQSHPNNNQIQLNQNLSSIFF